MSAGGISYSGVLGNRKVTLPSVESWGTNMNILRDPPKSIFTRKIDKVGVNQEVERMAESSTQDRYCENLQIYPRGINPSVSVSYSNYGNNGGKLMHFGKGNKNSGGSEMTDSGQAAVNNSDANNPNAGNNNQPGVGQASSSWEACSVSNGHTMTKYTHRIDLDGDFRPPLMPESRLAALSRLPRNVTNLYTNPLAPIWKDRNTCDTHVYKRATRPDLLSTSVRATSCHYLGPKASADTRTFSEGNVNKMINEKMINTNFTGNKAENIHTGTTNQTPLRGIQDIDNSTVLTAKATMMHDKDGAGANQINTDQFIAEPLI